MPALLISTSIGSPSSLPAKRAHLVDARDVHALDVHVRMLGSTMGASDSGTPSRRCVAMTFQPFGGVLLDELESQA